MEEAGDAFTIVERDMVPAAPIDDDETLQRQRKQVLNWLQPTDYLSPGNEYMKHLHSFLPGTGKWVQESPIFRSWRGEDMTGDAGTDTDSGYHHVAPSTAYGASCLHIRGVAGSGKSVFSASTIDQLQADGSIVLFFFFRQIVEKNHAAKYLVRDFAAQLLPHSDALVRELAELSKRDSVSNLGIDPLWSIITRVITEGGVDKQVFCVVDALDEMDDADFRDTMEKLITLGSANPRAVKAMLTSRPLPKVEQAVKNKAVVQLKLDPVLLSPDVARYVDARMASLEPRLSDDKCELVRQTICQRASGLFLHARLVADNLAQSLQERRVTEETLPGSLDRLPRSLREVYEEMLKEHARRSGVSADHQAKILTCVTHSSRPLRLIELGSLVAQMLGVDLRRGKELVRASCGRLLELLEDETVSVIHHSFTEFLHDGSRDEIPNAFPVLDDFQAHDMLAALCLEYLNSCPHFDVTIDETREANYEDYHFSDPESKRRDEIRTQLRLSHPLAAYAVENLGFHFGKSCDQSQSHGLAALDSNFQPKHPAFETWALMCCQDKLTSSINAMHLLVATEGDGAIPLVVIQHLADGHAPLIDLPDPHGRTPLILAAKLGRHDVVSFLLSMGADPKAASEDGMTPLHWAAEEGKTDTVRMLLEAGVDPMIKTVPVYYEWGGYERESVHYDEDTAQQQRRTALSVALHGSDSQVALQFIPFMPAEEAAAYFHGARTAQILGAILATGLVDVNSYSPEVEYSIDKYETTKLFEAAKSGELEMVKILLEHGADPTKREPGQPTALHAVAGVGYHSHTWFEEEGEKAIELVRLLVDAGADINATMNHRFEGAGYTPLHLSIRKEKDFLMHFGSYDKSEEVVSRALLKAGADPNATTSTGNTPIHLVNAEKMQLLQLLVEHGADIERRNSAGRSPFLNIIRGLVHERSDDKIKPEQVAASLHGLLDLGADPSAMDSYGNNAFHYIMHSIDMMGDPCYIPLVERLLKASADPNHKNNKGDVPLFWYKKCSPSSYGRGSKPSSYEQLLVLLLRNGMRLDIRNKDGDTLLHYLRGRYGAEIADMEKFIRLGADPNVLGSDGKSLFQKAIRSKSSSKWLEYLMKISNVSPHSIDDEGNTIVHDILTNFLVSDKEVETVLRLVVSAGADPLARNHKGQSALHVVPSLNAKVAIDSHYFRQLDINGRDTDGWTPLHGLVTCGEDTVADLLRRGAGPFIKSNTGLLPLHCAAQAGQAGVVGILLAQYRSQSVLLQDINSLGGGLSPLHYACQAGSAAVVAVLLRSGADPALAAAETGFTPLHMLSKFVPVEPDSDWQDLHIRTPEIVRMLHRRGVDVDATVFHATSEEKNQLVKATALDVAEGSKRWEVVRELLSCGASVRDRQRESPEFLVATDKEMALEATRKMKVKLDIEMSGLSEVEERQRRYQNHQWRGRWASSSYKPPEKVRGWILGSASLFDPQADRLGQSTSKFGVFKAALNEHDFDTIKEYHEQGGDILETGGGGNGDCSGFLQYLIRHGYEHLLRHFTDEAGRYNQKISVDDRGTSQMLFSSTLLGAACENATPSMNIVEWLVDEIGVDIDAPHLEKISCRELPAEAPLHILARGTSFWHLEALKYLLSKGANVEARTHDGLTPLLVALDVQRQPGRWNSEAVRLLLEHGANVNARTVKQPGDWDNEDEGEGEDEYEYEKYTFCAPDMTALDLAKDPEAFQHLISAGVDMTLSVAVLLRSVRMWMLPEAVEVLLNAGFDPNEEPPNKSDHRENFEHHHEVNTEGRHARFSSRFALHEAARPPTRRYEQEDLPERRVAMTKLLLSRGADPYSTYPDGSFVLQRIVEDRGLATLCLSSIKEAKVDLKGSCGRTLLIQACVPGVGVTCTSYRYKEERPVPTVMADAVQMLLGLGADVTLIDEQGRTALHWMCTQAVPFDAAYQEALEALIAKDRSILNVADKQGRLPLHLALEAFSSSGPKVSLDFAIRHLIASGADPSIPDPVSGDSALHHIARSLAGDEAKAVAEAKTLFQDLTASGLDINAQNNAGESVVAAAIASPYPEADRLYSSGYANGAEFAYTKVLRFLSRLGLGVKLDTADAKGRNLLHVAAARPIDHDRCNGRRTEGDMITELFKLLLDMGVDPRKEDDELRTPIDIAVARQLRDVVNLFSEEGKRAAEERKLKESESDNGDSDGEVGSSSESDD